MRLLLSFVWIQNYLLLTILEDPSSLTASSLKDGALLVSTSLLARIRGGGESESESPTQIKDDDGSGLKRIKMANFQLRKRKKLMIEEEKAVVDMDLRRYQAIKSLFPSFPDRTSRFGELRVPDHELYVRNGEHTWDGDVNVTGKTIFVRGEQGARLMGQWENRKELRCLEEPNFCIGLSGSSKGVLLAVELIHDTMGDFDACLKVLGGPWLLHHCKILSSHAMSLLCCQQADVLLRRSSLGGLSPAVEVSDQVYGSKVARFGVYARGRSSTILQACVLENNGWIGGIGARFSDHARGILESSTLRCNDIAVSLDHYAQVEVRRCIINRNAWSAYHVGYRTSTCNATLVDNQVSGREWFNCRRPGKKYKLSQLCYCGKACVRDCVTLDFIKDARRWRHQIAPRRPRDPFERFLYSDIHNQSDDMLGLHPLMKNKTLDIKTREEENGDIIADVQVLNKSDAPPPVFLEDLEQLDFFNETELEIEGLPWIAKTWDWQCSHTM
mmetsp:Transcript_33943/g.106392  ORF Transcript_33943/g.106392 Transcript_33943/m.106392 type:complete len:500 (-) Transcript_33943:85-1584(-)